MFYILLTITAYNLFIGMKYLLQIEKNMRDEKYIYNDHMHSLQHIAIFGITAVLAIAMIFWVHSDYDLVVSMFYNASLTFIIYPHLISEE